MKTKQTPKLKKPAAVRLHRRVRPTDIDAHLKKQQWEINRHEIASEVSLERHAQLEKWGEQSHDFGVWLAILTEEVGELAQAMLEFKFDRPAAPAIFHIPKIQREATQVAAVASAIVQYCRHGSA